MIADESCQTAADIPPLVGKVDGINIKLAKCGSLREAIRMIAIARAHHMMVMVGCMIESSIAHHRRGALHAAGGHRGPRRRGAARQRSLRRAPASPAGRSRCPTVPGWASGEMTERFAQVALPLPLASPYTYRIPETLADRVVPGARVVVPVRRRELVGIVVAVDAPAPAVRRTRHPRRARRRARAPAGCSPPPSGWRATTAPRSASRSRPCSRAGCGARRGSLASPHGDAVSTGGLAGEVLEWLERRGGAGPVSTVARALRRPLWDVVDRLARVGAVALRVEPPETGADAATERVVALTGRAAHAARARRALRRSPEQRRLYEASSAWAAACRSAT